MSPMNERKLWGIVLAAGEGTRARDFLQQLCGGRGIKQFCAVVGRRSLLEHTLARIKRLIPRAYFFCSKGCKEKFEQALEKYAPERRH